MKKACSFLIVCLCLLVVSCRSPQATTITKTVTIRDTITVNAPIPATESVALEIFPWDNQLDSFTVQDSFAWTTVVMVHDTIWKTRNYRVNFGRKADTIFIRVPVMLTDTLEIECPPTLPSIPTDGKFPWWWVLAALGALLVYFVGKKK